MSAETKEYVIKRTGKKDLALYGVKLAEVDNREVDGPRNSRWRYLALYQTVGERFVVEESHLTQWQGEEDRHDAAVFETLEAVVDHFAEGNELDPLGKELLEAADGRGIDLGGLLEERID
jgi:hypothetical protein